MQECAFFTNEKRAGKSTLIEGPMRQILAFVFVLVVFTPAFANNTPQPLPFGPQTWSNIGQIPFNDEWSNVPGITGYRGDNITTAMCCTDPQTLLVDGTNTPIDVQ